MKKTIGLFAHVDSGKTTLAEQILYLTHSIRNCGRVDYQNSFLDHHEIEKERGITVFAEQAYFNYNDNQYFLIDSPGHIDFSMEMERSIGVMDYAILIISAVEGIQSHTETIWTLLKTYEIPTFIFINKVDRVGANINQIVTEIREKFYGNPIFINNKEEIRNLTEDLIEKIAESDENLMMEYFNENLNQSFWIQAFQKGIKNRTLSPVMCGSALKNIGIGDFLDVIDVLTETSYRIEDEFSGRVYKVRYDEKGERITFIKALSGIFNVRGSLTQSLTQTQEKINQIRIYQGNKYETITKIEAGQLVGVTGLTEFKVGDGIGALKEKQLFELVPTLSVSVLFEETLNPRNVLACFRRLEDEDPSLNVYWNEITQQIQVNIMGRIQLDILKDLIKKRYKIEIDFGPCAVIYQETIMMPVIGRGHYEPLKHYAEVHLLLEPTNRGTGITFESRCHIEQLASNYQSLIKNYVLEDNLIGILTGSKVTDLKVTLLTGASHQKHTSGGDFKEATYRALRQGLEKAENILLEPYYEFKIEVELDLMGKIITDIQKANGIFEEPVIVGDRCMIRGRAPVSTFMNYPSQFLSITKGLGKISLRVFGYEKCHNEEEIILIKAYDKNGDRENPSASIFCAKGSGFVVPWDLADEYMHCK